MSSSKGDRPFTLGQVEFVSGMLAGLVAVTLTAPLEVARNRMTVKGFSESKKAGYGGIIQSLQTIIREEGLRGCYKGYNVTLVCYPLFYSLFFPLYNSSKVYFRSRVSGSDPFRVDLKVNVLSSMTAGVISDFLTNPLWLVRTRIQTEYIHSPKLPKYSGIYESLRTIVKEEGLRGLYKGFVANLMGVSHAAIYFPAYEELKNRLAREDFNKMLGILLASSLAKVIALSISYPHVLVRTRMYDNREQYVAIKENSNLYLRNLMKNIFREEGIGGFYVGFRLELVRVVPSNAIIFLVYEYVKSKMEEYG